MTTMNRLRWLALLPLAAVTLTACDDETAITREPVGERAYGVRFSPSTFFNFPRGTVTLPSSPTGDNVTVTLFGLDSLQGGVYQIWAGDAAGTSFKRLTGTLTIARTDTVRNALGDDVPETVTLPPIANVSSFTNGGPNLRFTFAATRSGSGLSASDEISTILVTTDPAPGDTPDASRAFLFARRGSGTSATFRFGNYATDPDDDFVYLANPNAVGRGRADFRGEVLAINDTLLQRPPRGFLYVGYLVRRGTDGKVIDHLDLGPMTTPFPGRVSLENADTQIVDPAYVFDEPYAIFAGAWRVLWSNAPAEVRNRDLSGSRVPEERRNRPFPGFEEIVINLKNRAGVPGQPGPAFPLRAPIPTIVSGI